MKEGRNEAYLALVESLRFDFPLRLKSINHILVAPAVLVAQALDGAPFAARLQPQDPKCLRNDHLLLAVKWWGHALVKLEALKSSSTASGFVGDHSADGFVKNAGRSTVMEGTALLRVDQMAFVHVVGPTKL